MIGAVAGRAVGVAVPVISRQQTLQGVQQIVVGAGPGFDDGKPSRRVWNEDVAQTVAPLGAEPGDLGGEIYETSAAGIDGEYVGEHSPSLRTRGRSC